MSTRTFTLLFIAPAQSIELGAGGRLLYIKQAAAALTVQTIGTPSAPATLENVGAGLKYRRPDRWSRLRITSATIQSVEIVVSDDDDIDFANAVSVTGVAVVQESPAVAVADTAPVVRPTATQAALFAVSASRRRITVYADSANAGSCFARVAGGANNIAELQPGVSQQFSGLYALDVRNDTGANATFYIFEES